MKKNIKKVLIFICLIYILGSLGYIFYRIVFCRTIFKLVGEKEIYLTINSNYQELGYSLTSLDKISSGVLITNNINNKKIGTYQVIYKYKNKTLIRKIKVVDNIPPSITLKGDTTTYVCPNTKYVEEGYTVIDNYDKNLDNKVKVEVKNDKIIYTVKDKSNNETKVIRNLIYKDIKSPEISFIDKKVVYINESFKDDYKAIDNCDGDITDQVIVKGKVNTSSLGEYNLIYEVTDKSGNKNIKTRKIIVKQKKSNDKVIYLTFDDGPSLNATPIILETLKKYNIQATFFVINHESSTNYLLKQEKMDGHTVAYHSYSHQYKYIYQSETNFWNDIKNIETRVESVIGTNSKIIRFPGGSSNTISRFNPGIMTRLTKQATEKGYKYFDWNVDSNDTSTNDSNKICYNVINTLHNGRNIVLMHDASTKKASAEALDCIIQNALIKGYRFEKITESTDELHHPVNN